MVRRLSITSSYICCIGTEGESDMIHNIAQGSYLRYARRVIESLRRRYDDYPGQTELLDLINYDDMTAVEKISFLWQNRDTGSDWGNQQVSHDPPDNIADGDGGGDDIDVDITLLPDVETYKNIIRQASAYKWLVQRIESLNRLECPGPLDAQTVIRDTILHAICQKSHFSRGPLPNVSIVYHLDWNLSTFHAEQHYACRLDQVFERAITITGFNNDVQAATCLGYVEQTWGPVGVRLLRILEQVVLSSSNVTTSLPNDIQATQSLSAELSISALHKNGQFTVSASGIPYSVAEVGEILAWLAASLRSSPTKGRAMVCRPVISSLLFPKASGTSMAVDRVVTGLCELGVEFQSLSEDMSGESLGSCWLNAFRDPVIVQGYPILRRVRAGSGLELSVEMMSSLTNASYLVSFCRRTYLKGFSTMSFVAEVIGPTIFWHLLRSKDGTYISYEDARVPRVPENDAQQIVNHTIFTTGRHILGWCTKVSCLAGMSLCLTEAAFQIFRYKRLTGHRNARSKL